jgi:hypothetical protein
MIIDRVRVSGIRAYLQDPNNPGSPNLAGPNSIVARSAPLGKGQQWQVGGVSFVMEANDLTPLFDRAAEPPSGPAPAPLFSVTVQKEIFPGLFTDPYQHRVHNIAGFDDFKRGTFENCKAFEIEGTPTIVSVGTGPCRWLSQVYELPAPVSFDLAAWELAASRKAPNRSFSYSINLLWWPAGQTPSASPTTTSLASSASPTAIRLARPASVANVAFYQIEFIANVRSDAAIDEKHAAILRDSMGRPLLRAVNLLEPIGSANNFYTLGELLARCPDYHLFEGTAPPLKKLWACLDLSVTLVNSPNQKAGVGNSDYEFIEVTTAGAQFTRFQACLHADELVRPEIG